MHVPAYKDGVIGDSLWARVAGHGGKRRWPAALRLRARLVVLVQAMRFFRDTSHTILGTRRANEIFFW